MINFLNQIRFPTLFGLSLIVFGIGASVYLTIQNQTLISQAAPDQTPVEVKLTNIEAGSVTISWRTNAEVTGFVTFGQNQLSEVALDDADKDKPTSRSLHFVTLTNLTPATTYKYKIISGKLNNLKEQEFTTASSTELQNGAKPIIGNVIDNNRPLEEGIVYLDITGATAQAAQVKNFGSFIIPISLMRTFDLSEIFTPEGDLAKITAITKDNRRGSITFNLSEDNNLPQPIRIGQDQDLTKHEQNTLGVSTSLIESFGKLLDDRFDLNKDGKINSLDYAYLLKNFGRDPNDKNTDLNGDGVVNKEDQDILSREINKETNK